MLVFVATDIDSLLTFSSAPKRQKKTNSKFRFMDLPAELRNDISTCVLVTDEVITIRKEKYTAYERRTKPTLPMIRSWHEPALLQLSKQIRTEASSIYYVDNRFKFRIDTDGMDKVYAFIRTKTTGPSITMDYRLQIRNARWKGMACWFSLAKLVYESARDYGGLKFADTVLEACSCERYVMTALIEVVYMAGRARQRGLPYECLVDDFRLWLVAKLVCAPRNKIQNPEEVGRDFGRRVQGLKSGSA